MMEDREWRAWNRMGPWNRDKDDRVNRDRDTREKAEWSADNLSLFGWRKNSKAKNSHITQKNQTRGLICKIAFRFILELCRTVRLCPICKRISIIRNLTDAEDQEFFENPFLCMYHPLCSYSTFVTHSKAIHTLNPDVDKYLQIKIALTLFWG